MIRRHHFVPRALAGGLLAAGLVLSALEGCATRTVTPEPIDQPPAASSSAGAVQRFAWAMNHKDPETIRGLLTDDFLFVSAGLDSAGNPGRIGHDRTWMSEALAALLDSSSSVSLVLDQNLIPFPDSRPGRDPRFHKQIRTSIQLTVRDSTNIDVGGNALFFVTRGDSAAIPRELVSQSVKADSTTWWIDRMEDETLASQRTPAATDPSRQITLSVVLEYYYSLLTR